MAEYIEREKAENTTWEEPSYTDALNALTEVRERLREIKPADVVLVIHARWIRSYDRVANTFYWECSNCDRGVEHITAFCPHCGAKMESEEV